MNPPPSNIQCQHYGSSITLKRRWFVPTLLAPLFIFLILGVWVLPTYKDELFQPNNIWIVVFISPWFAYVIYYLMAHLFNTTTISATSNATEDSITAKQTPFPLKLTTTHTLSDISQFTVGEKKNQGRSRHTVYSVRGKTKDQAIIILEGQIRQYDQALFAVNSLNAFTQKTNHS